LMPIQQLLKEQSFDSDDINLLSSALSGCLGLLSSRTSIYSREYEVAHTSPQKISRRLTVRATARGPCDGRRRRTHYL
jgi:hypothetical protein